MPLMQYDEKDGCTHVPLRLGPTESVFIVFRRPADAASRIVSVAVTGRRPTRNTAIIRARSHAERDHTAGPLRAEDGRWPEPRDRCPGLAEALTIGGPWEVAFDPKWGGPAKVTFEKLDDWSKRPEEGIKYYSGAASVPYDLHDQPPDGETG